MIQVEMVTLVLFLCHFQIDISFTKASLRDVVSKVERCPKVSSVTNFDVLSLADNFFSRSQSTVSA